MTTEALYLQKLATAFATGEAQDLVPPPDLDWHRFGRLLGQHHASATLVPLLEAGSVPQDQLDRFQEMAEASRARTRLFLLELERILPIIGRRGIEPVVLKGAALAIERYPRPEQRYFLDLDLLVRPDEVDGVCAALAEQGYSRIDSGLDPTYYSKHHFHWILGNARGHVVEIHWGLTLPASVYSFDPRGVMNRSVEVDLGRIGLRVPSSEDQLLHLVLQGIAAGFTSLKHVLDAALLLPQIKDWPQLAQRARDLRLETGLWILLEMVAETIGTETVRNGQAALLPTDTGDPVADALRQERVDRLRRFDFTGLCLDRRFAALPNYHQLIHWMCLEDSGVRRDEIRRFLVMDEADLMEQGYHSGQMPGPVRRSMMTVSRFLSLTRLSMLKYSRMTWRTGGG